MKKLSAARRQRILEKLADTPKKPWSLKTGKELMQMYGLGGPPSSMSRKALLGLLLGGLGTGTAVGYGIHRLKKS